MHRFALLGLAVLVGCGGASARPQPIRPTPCWFPPLAGVRVDCGRLTVPEDGARPGGRKVELAVAVFHSLSDAPKRDPVVFLTGGPGGAGIALVRYVFRGYGEPFLHDRDLIVLDPRGSGWSRPALACGREEHAAACLARWRRSGVDLTAYQSAATADDVEALRTALGIERWNVYGLSYGTRLALTLLRDHPEHVRSAILDSVVAPQLDELASTSKNAAEAIQRLLDRCAADARCDAAYPDLPAALREAVVRLRERPLPLPGGGSLDGETLLRFVYATLYDAPWIPQLPRAIEAARAGRLDPLWPKVAREQEQIRSLVSQAAHDAWICNEQAPFSTPARIAAVDRRYPDVAGVFSQRWMLDVCRAAGLGRRAPAVENRAVRSRVPTLLVTGRLDPVSPVEQARAAARTLSRSRVVVFPTLGHGVFNQSPCARRIALAFLDRPERQPDTGCVARMPPIAWAAAPPATAGRIRARA